MLIAGNMVLWLVVTTAVAALVVASVTAWGAWRLVARWRDPFEHVTTVDEARRVAEHVATGALALAGAWGAMQLLTAIFPGGSAGVSAGGIARGFLTSLAVPGFAAAMWWLASRRLAPDAKERGEPAWSWHVAVVTTISVTVVVVAVDGLGSWALGAEGELARNITRLVPWSALLAAYLALAARWLPRHQRQTAWLGATLVGLLVATTGLARVVGEAGSLLVLLLSESGSVDWSRLVPHAVTTVVGSLAWAGAWRGARRIPRSKLLVAWVLIAMTGGMLGVTLGAYSILVDGLTWLLGVREGTPVEHFDSLAAAVAAIVVGVAVWSYHRRVLGAPALRRRPELVRAQQYLAATAGVVATAVGGITLVAAGIDFLSGGDILRTSVERSTVVMPDLALLMVGAVLWSSQWSDIKQAAEASGEAHRSRHSAPAAMRGVATPPPVVGSLQGAPVTAEQASPTRRVFLASVTIAAGVVGFASLFQTGLVVADQVVRSDADAMSAFRAVAWPLATLLVAGTVAAVHGIIWLGDRDTAVANGRQFPQRVLLVGPADGGIVEELAAMTGARVDLYARRDGVGMPWQAESIASSLHDLDHDHVMVLAGPQGVTLIPLDSGSG